MIHLISLREFALFLSQLREEVRWVVCFSSLSYLTTSVICNQNQHASHHIWDQLTFINLPIVSRSGTSFGKIVLIILLPKSH